MEEVRRYLESKYGTDQVHEGGLRVYTTLDMNLQWAANQAVLDGLAVYERRHGWQGHLENVLLERQTLASYKHPDWEGQLDPGSYAHALVTEVSSSTATLKIASYTATLSAADVAWSRQPMARMLGPGDVVYVKLLALGPGARARVSLEQD